MNNQSVQKLRVTTLVEDTCPKRPFWGEHGLSFWVEADDKNILFDTGQSGKVLIRNLEVLGLKLGDIDAFVLSHPHNDHSGGLGVIAKQIKDVPMYCISDAFKEFISGGEGVSKVMSDVNYIEEDLEIFPGVWIPKERKTINTPKVTKEINGLQNLIDDASSLFKNEIPIYALFGGLHLKDTEEEEIIRVVSSLKKSGLKILAPNYCTGFRALKIMAERFPREMELVANTDTKTFYTGMKIEL